MRNTEMVVGEREREGHFVPGNDGAITEKREDRKKQERNERLPGTDTVTVCEQNLNELQCLFSKRCTD